MPSSTGHVVHIIDDDAAVRDSLRVLLMAHDISVMAYASALGFLAEYQPGTKGCIILDLDMPDMSGIELMEHMRNHGPDLPVIVFTGRGDPRLRDDLRPVAVLVKPLDVGRLLNAIREAIWD